ncbi:hypothetical protein ACLMJK_003887 [Lecanora helva]
MSSKPQRQPRSSPARPPPPTQRPPAGRRTPSNVQRTEVLINVYDLLPPGFLSTTLWTLGSSLLHTGVVIRSLNREYAFGGHDRPHASGVYWTKPCTEPPGGTFRCELLQGVTFRSNTEIEGIIREVSGEFMGGSYNLLTNNCNHFTNEMCKRLVGRQAPGWLNRAASIGVALPCVVPRDWIAPPEFETADGELLEEDEEDDDERTSMLRQEYRRGSASFRGRGVDSEDEGWSSERDRRTGGNGKGKGKVTDAEGRRMPASERAPVPRGR